MKLALFSDLHIKNKKELIYLKFLEDLKNLPQDLGYLIFLGDIFNFLYGNADWLIQEYPDLFKLLSKLSKQSVKIYYIFGNHDFNFSFHTIDYINVAEHFVLDFKDKKVLLLHGDGIGEKDNVYKFLKSILRSRMFFYVYKIFPRYVVYKIANLFAYISRKLGNRKSKMNVKKFYRTRASILAKQANSKIVFMGHSHIKDHFKTKNFEYINVGEFKKNGYYIYEL